MSQSIRHDILILDPPPFKSTYKSPDYNQFWLLTVQTLWRGEWQPFQIVYQGPLTKYIADSYEDRKEVMILWSQTIQQFEYELLKKVLTGQHQ